MLDDSAVPLVPVQVQAALRGAAPTREGVGVLAVGAARGGAAENPAGEPEFR
jgi:hypothetical protein